MTTSPPDGAQIQRREALARLMSDELRSENVPNTFYDHRVEEESIVDAADAIIASGWRPPILPAEPAGEPVAWRVKDYADGWIMFHDESAALREVAETGGLMQPLYLAAPPSPAHAPTSGDGPARLKACATTCVALDACASDGGLGERSLPKAITCAERVLRDGLGSIRRHGFDESDLRALIAAARAHPHTPPPVDEAGLRTVAQAMYEIRPLHAPSFGKGNWPMSWDQLCERGLEEDFVVRAQAAITAIRSL